MDEEINNLVNAIEILVSAKISERLNENRAHEVSYAKNTKLAVSNLSMILVKILTQKNKSTVVRSVKLHSADDDISRNDTEKIIAINVEDYDNPPSTK